MKTYAFAKNKNYLFIAPTGWGKTMGIVLPEANSNDDVLLFACLSSGQEALLSPFVTYVRGSSFTDNSKKVDEVIAIAKTCPISRIIIDETANLLCANDLASLLTVSEKRGIPVLLTFQSEEQARTVGINFNAFEIINTNDDGFTQDDFHRLYSDGICKEEAAPAKGNVEYIKKKTAPADIVTIDFDGFVSRVATYTVLSPGLVTDILKDYIIPAADVHKKKGEYLC